MRKCQNCGQEIFHESKYCPNCGFNLSDHVFSHSEYNTYYEQPRKADSSERLGFWAIIGGIFIPLLGWILGGMTISRAKKANNEKARKRGVIAVIIGTINFFINLMILS